MKLKTEKRHAKTGESILITNAKSQYNEYRNGNILTVIYADPNCNGIVSVEESGELVYPFEYEVVVEEE